MCVCVYVYCSACMYDCMFVKCLTHSTTVGFQVRSDGFFRVSANGAKCEEASTEWGRGSVHHTGAYMHYKHAYFDTLLKLSTLCFPLLHCTALHCTALHCTVFYCVSCPCPCPCRCARGLLRLSSPWVQALAKTVNPLVSRCTHVDVYTFYTNFYTPTCTHVMPHCCFCRRCFFSSNKTTPRNDVSRGLCTWNCGCHSLTHSFTHHSQLVSPHILLEEVFPEFSG